jgi:pre-mRNA-processing factor 17
MHSITATAMHPSGEYYAGQSSDNQIIIYENKGGNFRRIRAKKFASHYCAGYACAIDFSYDGQFLVSGDERGKIYCYDWKTTKVFRILDGHAGACIGVEWHPSQPTTMLTCGWEGMVKLWQ